MKKILVLLVLCVMLVGCNKKETEWIKNKNLESMLDIESKEVFDKALAKSDFKLEAITLLGTQVVAGTNYMYFALSEDKDYKIVIVYKDLEGNSTISKVIDFDLNNYAGKRIDKNIETLSGGWNVNENVNTSLDSDVLNIFNKSVEQLMGASYKPIILLGTKEDSGTNYAILSLRTLVLENPVSSFVILTINNDKEITLKTIASIDLAEYNK